MALKPTFNFQTGKLDFYQDLSGYVPYTGATANLNMGAYDITTTGDITGGNLNISNWNTAYSHSQDNTQAHSDYLTNNGDTGVGNYIWTTGSQLWSGTTGGTPTSGAGTRMMWIPAKAAFRVGKVTGSDWDDGNIGTGSIALGENTKATGSKSISIGNNADAVNTNAITIGTGNATGVNSTAIGSGGTLASGSQSVAIGDSATASGTQAIAMGFGCEASGDQSFTCGYNSDAKSTSSFAGGYASDVTGTGSFGYGSGCKVVGSYSVAFGRNAYARQEGHFAYSSRANWESGNDNDNQAVFTIVKGMAEAEDSITLSGSYEIPEDTTIVFTITINARANDGESGMAVRRVCVQDIGGTTTIVGTVQTIGTDQFSEDILDAINIDVGGNEMEIEIENAYTEEVGYVAKIEAVENKFSYTAPT